MIRSVAVGRITYRVLFALAMLLAERSVATPLNGNVPPQLREATDTGRLDANMHMNAWLYLRPSAEQRAGMDALLARQRDPGSPDYQRWITPDEFAARFGASPAAQQRVESWLESHGLAVARRARNGLRIDFSGTAAQLEQAFGTELHAVRVLGEPHFTNVTAPSVPASLADIVLRVGGLDDFRPWSAQRRPHYFTSATGHALAPEDFAAIYDLQRLYAQGTTGAGVTLAVAGRTSYPRSDIDTFRSLARLPAISLQNVLVPGSGDATFVGSDDDVSEAELDLEWSGAVARDSSIVYVYTGGDSSFDVPDALEYAISEKLGNIVSYSYAICEPLAPTSFVQAALTLLDEASMQGMTVVAASGDSGAAGCDGHSTQPALTGLAVSLPSSIPQVVAAGGTEFNENARQYWNAVSDGAYGSARSYIPETSWNDTGFDLSFGGELAASGGGVSVLFSKPAWQLNDGTSSNGRDVPDVALNASAAHDGYLICHDGGCVNGWADANGNTDVTGGTSAAAPTFAGVLALLFQQAVPDPGCPIGWGDTSARLYSMAASVPEAFHDIAEGNNIVPCQLQTSDCPANPPYEIGYHAGPGYDLVTGLGSIDGFNLWLASRAETTTTLSTSAVTKSPVVLTATVTTPASCPAITGSVTFSNGTTILGTASVTPVSGATQMGTATFSVPGLPGGIDHLTAFYSGDRTYRASVSSPVEVRTPSGCAATPVDWMALAVLAALLRPWRASRERR